MKRAAALLLAAVFLAWSSRGSALPLDLGEGTFSLGGRGLVLDGNSAQFEPYRDLRSGPFGAFRLGAFKGDLFLEARGDNTGYRDQSYRLEGGALGTCKLSLLYDQTPHAISEDARTFYAGIGTPSLHYEAPDRPRNTDLFFTPTVPGSPARWSVFDYETLRTRSGGGLRLTLPSPFSLSLEYQEDRKKGVRPFGLQSGVFPDVATLMLSDYGNLVELPAPVDTVTRNLFLRTGYRAEGVNLTLRGVLSTFDNHDNTLVWRNPYVTTQTLSEAASLAPDSLYYKVSGRVVLDRLPFTSTLALDGGYSRLSNDVPLGQTLAQSTDGLGLSPLFGILSPVYGSTELELSRPSFRGDIAETTLAGSLRSRPTKRLDVRARFRYRDRDNQSSIIRFTDPFTGAVLESDVLGSRRSEAGVEMSYQLPLRSWAAAGYGFRRVDRYGRTDAESTTDHRVFVEVKNRVLNVLHGKVRYEHLERRSRFGNGSVGTDVYDPLAVRRFVRSFDVTDKSQDAVNLKVEILPVDALGIGLSYSFRRDDYPQTQLGLTRAREHEICLDASYDLRRWCRVSGFLGFEENRSQGSQRYFDIFPIPLFPPLNTDPSSGTTVTPNPFMELLFGRATTAYNWSDEIRSRFWTLGLSVELPVTRYDLDLAVSWMCRISDGSVRFSTQGVRPLREIPDVADYTLQSVEVRATYAILPDLSTTASYRFESYLYRDTRVEGYTYALNAPFNRYFLSGAYADNRYDAHVLYLLLTYTFG